MGTLGLWLTSASVAELSKRCLMNVHGCSWWQHSWPLLCCQFPIRLQSLWSSFLFFRSLAVFCKVGRMTQEWGLDPWNITELSEPAFSMCKPSGPATVCLQGAHVPVGEVEGNGSDLCQLLGHTQNVTLLRGSGTKGHYCSWSSLVW